MNKSKDEYWPSWLLPTVLLMSLATVNGAIELLHQSNAIEDRHMKVILKVFNAEGKEEGVETIPIVSLSMKLRMFSDEHELGTLIIPDAPLIPGLLYSDVFLGDERTLWQYYADHGVTQLVSDRTRTSIILHGYRQAIIVVEAQDARVLSGQRNKITWKEFAHTATMQQVAIRLGAHHIANRFGTQVYPAAHQLTVLDVFLQTGEENQGPVIKIFIGQ